MEREIEQAKLSDQFAKVEKLLSEFSNGQHCDELHYKEAITLLNGITNLIKEHGLFSPNEDFIEIKVEYLK